MASIVQVKQYAAASGTTHTITLDSAATNGNDIIFLGYAYSQVFSGSCTFGGSNMTTDLSTNFGLWRIARFRVNAAGTALVCTLAASDTFRGIAIEVSGLDSSPLEATVGRSVSGEGPATSHSLEYASGAANRIGFAFAYSGGHTFTAANGSTVLSHEDASFPSEGAIIYKDALGTGAGSLDFTLNAASNVDYMAVTYLTAGGSSQGKAARLLI